MCARWSGVRNRVIAGHRRHHHASTAMTGHPTTVSIEPSSPYYEAAKALAGRQVQAGTMVGGCTINAFTDCPGAGLAGEYLQGAFLAYSDLTNANLAGVNLLQADVAYANLDGADLSDAQINATSTTKATFRHADLQRSQWVLAAGSHTDFSYADLRGVNFTSGVACRVDVDRRRPQRSQPDPRRPHGRRSLRHDPHRGELLPDDHARRHRTQPPTIGVGRRRDVRSNSPIDELAPRGRPLQSLLLVGPRLRTRRSWRREPSSNTAVWNPERRAPAPT